MTQDAVVTKITPDGFALVTVERGTACGGNCGACGGCNYKQQLTVRARNAVCASVGGRVRIESSTKTVLSSAALVYLLPLACLFLGCFAAVLFRLSELWTILLSLGGLAICQ